MRTADQKIFIGLIFQIGGMTITVLLSLIEFHKKKGYWLKMDDLIYEVDLFFTQLGIQVSYAPIFWFTNAVSFGLASPQVIV